MIDQLVTPDSAWTYSASTVLAGGRQAIFVVASGPSVRSLPSVVNVPGESVAASEPGHHAVRAEFDRRRDVRQIGRLAELDQVPARAG